MPATSSSEKVNREELKAKRKVLFKLFLKNPMHIALAVEIKMIDDQLADSTQWWSGTKTSGSRFEERTFHAVNQARDDSAG